MRTEDVWRKLFGWQVGDFFKYYHQGDNQGAWIYVRIVDKSHDGFVKVRTVKKQRKIPREFNIQINYLELYFPHNLQSYYPRKVTVKKFEEETN